MISKWFLIFGLLFTLMGLTGCVHTTGIHNPEDPWESVNRRVYRFNKGLDQLMLKPAARTYQKVMPAGLKKAFHQFFNNIDDVMVTLNDLLQGNLKQAGRDGARLVVNTTWGVLGFADPASRAGAPKRETDFGVTLGSWGFRRSPYVVLPFLGPSTVRDGIGRAANLYMNPVWYMHPKELKWGLIGFSFLDARVQFLDKEDLIKASALDEYAFVRDAYLQRRAYLITGARHSEKKEDQTDW